jgi:hypothetical protein
MSDGTASSKRGARELTHLTNPGLLGQLEDVMAECKVIGLSRAALKRAVDAYWDGVDITGHGYEWVDE